MIVDTSLQRMTQGICGLAKTSKSLLNNLRFSCHKLITACHIHWYSLTFTTTMIISTVWDATKRSPPPDIVLTPIPHPACFAPGVRSLLPSLHRYLGYHKMYPFQSYTHQCTHSPFPLHSSLLLGPPLYPPMRLHFPPFLPPGYHPSPSCPPLSFPLSPLILSLPGLHTALLQLSRAGPAVVSFASTKPICLTPSQMPARLSRTSRSLLPVVMVMPSNIVISISLLSLLPFPHNPSPDYVGYWPSSKSVVVAHQGTDRTKL